MHMLLMISLHFKALAGR